MSLRDLTLHLDDGTLRVLKQLGDPAELLARLARATAHSLRHPGHLGRPHTDQSLRAERDRADEVVSLRDLADDERDAAARSLGRELLLSLEERDAQRRARHTYLEIERQSTDQGLRGERARADTLFVDQREANQQLVSATLRAHELTAEAEEARVRAETSEQELREVAEFREMFIGILGHDLRNPVGAIGMAASWLMMRGQLDDEDAKTVGRIQRSCKRVTGMIAQMLDLTRARLGGGLPIQPQPADLAELARSVADEFDAGVRIEISGDVTGTWDGDRLSEVLSNLIGNGIQHGAGSEVRVAISGAPEEVIVEVSNAGKPISAEDLPYIFEPFRRGARDKQKSTSLGLGLYIAHQIVLSHGGRLDARSADGRTTFTLRLPRHSVAAGEVARRRLPSEPPVPRRSFAPPPDGDARFRALFESPRVAIAEADAETGRIRRVNAAFAALLGQPPSALLDRTLAALTHPDEAAESHVRYARLLEGRVPTYAMDQRLLGVDGTTVWVHLTVSVVRDPSGAPIGTVVVAVDLTERRRAEALQRDTLAQLRAHAGGITMSGLAVRDADGPRLAIAQLLEEAVASRDAARALNETLAANELALRSALESSQSELARVEGRKRELLAMLNHELRNPLAALAHGLDVLSRVSGDRAQGEKLRAMMVRQTQRIAALLDQLLDVTGVISGNVTLSELPVDLVDVARAAADTVAPLLEDKGQSLSLVLPADRARVLGDAERLTQIVEQLLTNASKYSPPGGSIRLSVAIGPQDTIRLVVGDDGVGMEPELVERCFGLFVQAPRTLDRAQGGLGLGLPLVRRLVELHGGEVTASSAGPGLGTTMTVTLPAHTRPSDRPSVAPPLRKCRILVIDDEEDIAELLARRLTSDGHQALAVCDGTSAIEAVTTFAPEIVLLDLGLIDMDGYEVAARVRQALEGRPALLVAVTGYQKDQARLSQAGFDRHLLKPPDMETLSAYIAAWDGDRARPGGVA